jgi:hypothetical protein
MTADDHSRQAIPIVPQRRPTRRRLRETARRTLLRVAPAYARRRNREAHVVGAIVRLEADFGHLGERHGEQIERLEELVRELVLTAESLRREIAKASEAAEQVRHDTPRDRGAEG